MRAVVVHEPAAVLLGTGPAAEFGGSRAAAMIWAAAVVWAAAIVRAVAVLRAAVVRAAVS